MAGFGRARDRVHRGFEPVRRNSVPVLIMLILATVFFHLRAAHTPFGRHLYAIGGNREAAFYSRLHIKNISFRFPRSWAPCAAWRASCGPRAVGAAPRRGSHDGADAIAAAVIGGNVAHGRPRTVWGARWDALMMASLDNGMSLMNTEAFWQPIIKRGGILILAVALDMMGRKGKI